MRVRCSKVLTVFIAAINVLILYYIIRTISFDSFNQFSDIHNRHNSRNRTARRDVGQIITLVMREFEGHENDVAATAHSFLNALPGAQLFILYNKTPYPPLDLSVLNSTRSRIKLIQLSPHLNVSLHRRYPLFQIKAKYVLFIPDSTRVTSKQDLQKLILEANKWPKNIIAAPVDFRKRTLTCLALNANVKEWTLRYGITNNFLCDEVIGKHVLLIETEVLRELSDAFLLPFPHSLYIQTSLLHIKARILKGSLFHDGKPVLKSHHAQWKLKQMYDQRLKAFYNMFNIKQVVRETGTTEWYGCTRDTPRCFETVLDSMPSYLYEGKWTPPCCLSNLRKTAKHVFNILDEVGVRFWLESGSLLGAMRSGDVLPWDHDVDVGFIRDDLDRCSWLKKSKYKSVIDNKGFLWEKATEGNFFRVHYSKVNKIYVNLFPFYLKNGTMMRDSWFTSHKNMEFSESFLHPMSSIEFVGRSVPSPNNIRDFLEMKFGKGCIENPEYPNPGKLKFP